jgi:hypothetical protein
MGILNSYDPDPCCGKAICKALASGALETATIWACPNCGLEWKPVIATAYLRSVCVRWQLLDDKITPIPEENRIRHWRPVPAVAIVGMR